MRIDKINIGDIVCAGYFGYKVLSKDVEKNLVRVNTVYKFENFACKTIAETYENSRIYTVEPSCFKCKYNTKAVIV